MLQRIRIAFPGLVPEGLKSVWLRLRERDADKRALPDFLVIGAQKSGSTSLFNYLCLHPKVEGALPKEIFFFDREYHRGEYWYRRHFPRIDSLKKKKALTGEATTMYLCSPEAPKRVSECVPNVRLIAVLREPAARAVSHYYHRRRMGRETRPINDVFCEKTINDWKEGKPLSPDDALYFERGDYATQLSRWLEYFPRNQLCVVKAENLFADPQTVVNQVFTFLGLEPFPLPTTRAFNVNREQTVRPRHYNQLRESFAPGNQALRDMGYPMGWAEISRLKL